LLLTILQVKKINWIVIPICRKYHDLPEMKQKAVEKKRQEEYKTNRIRAQLYKQVMHI